MLNAHPRSVEKIVLCVLIWCFSVLVNGQNLYRSGIIAGTEIWDADTVFVTDTLFVGATGRLYIYAGTTVLAGNNPIYCDGYLNASGDAGNPVRFTHIDTLGLYDTYSDAGGWKGIWFMNTDSTRQDTAIFRHCIVSYAKPQPFREGGALRFEGWQHAEFYGCRFVHNVNALWPAAIWMVKYGSCLIDSCLFAYNRTNNEGGAIRISADYSRITRSVFFWNKSFFGDEWASQGKFSAGVVGRGKPNANNAAINADTSYTRIEGNLFAYNFSVSSTFGVGTKKSEICNNVFLGNIGGGLIIGTGSKHYEKHKIVNNTFINNTDNGLFFWTDSIYFISNVLWNNGMNLWPAREIDRLPRPQGGGSFFPHIFQNNIVKGGYPLGENTIIDAPSFVNPPHYLLPGEHSDLFSLPPDTLNWRNYDFRPYEYSVTVDNGYLDLSRYPEMIKDYYGNPRFMGPAPDIGASEFLDFSSISESAPDEVLFSIHPNPAMNYAQLELRDNELPTAIELYDMSGRLCKQISTEFNSSLMIDLHDLKPGLYMLSVRFPSGIYSQKLLITR